MAVQPSHIFISYQRTDDAFARQVRDRLAQAGVRVWMDQFDIPVGAYWPDEIDKGLGASAIVVGILSPDAVASRNVKNEWDWAIQNDKRLLLLQAVPCALPHRYISINYIDATGPDPAPAIAALLTTLGIAPPEADSATPETRYARSGSVNIAYQVIGSGPFDLVLTVGAVSNVEDFWEEPSFARCLRRFGSFCRLIVYDKRGTGLSDRVTDLPPLEERMDDVRAVMDAAGSERAVLMGASEGGPLSILFAATYPDRVTALILYGTMARMAWAPDYPWGRTEVEQQKRLEATERNWGRTVDASVMAPSRAGDEQFTRWLGRHLRRSASPGAAVALQRMNWEIDVRPILPTIRIPTLVLHREDDRTVVADRGRDIAARIPGAHFVALPGADHFITIGDQDSVFGAIQSFLDGVQTAAEADTVLATLLVVPRADGLVDAPVDALDGYRALIRASLARFRGHEAQDANTMTVATFDGPARAIRCAGAIVAGARALGIATRAGLHTGEVELRGDAVSGIAVDITTQIADLAGAGEILVSSMVRDLVPGSGIRFNDRGSKTLAGIADAWHVFGVDLDSVH